MRAIGLLVVLALVLVACGGSVAEDPERFCELLEEIDAQDTTDLAADEALEVIQEGREKFVEAAELAPDEIKSEVETVTDVALQLTDLLIEAGGDESRVDVEELVIDEDEFDDANVAVDAWRAANCS